MGSITRVYLHVQQARPLEAWLYGKLARKQGSTPPPPIAGPTTSRHADCACAMPADGLAWLNLLGAFEDVGQCMAFEQVDVYSEEHAASMHDLRTEGKA